MPIGRAAKRAWRSRRTWGGQWQCLGWNQGWILVLCSGIGGHVGGGRGGNRRSEGGRQRSLKELVSGNGRRREGDEREEKRSKVNKR